jgi:acyl carrier protein
VSDRVFLQVRKLIAGQLRVDEERITMDTSFREDLRADSLDLVELIMLLEETYDLEIEESVAENIKSVGNAVEYIRKYAK